jgi:lipoyl(octanoyl) transferase
MSFQDIFFVETPNAKYEAIWACQEEILKQNTEIKKAFYQDAHNTNPLLCNTKHYLMLLEHKHVYTIGKSGKESNLLVSPEYLQQHDIELFKINRGGDITYHGPGQLVGYPILDLEKMFTDIGKYLRLLEECIIEVIAHYGLQGMRSPGETGVWLDADIAGKERKICAMGVRCSRWITMHGFALNVNTDLSYFDNIVPCGIENKGVTSIEKELGRTVDMAAVKKLFISAFEKNFNAQVQFEPQPQLSF